jgi:hypothetical protein
LDLAFNIRAVDRFADVLGRDIAQDGGCQRSSVSAFLAAISLSESGGEIADIAGSRPSVTILPNHTIDIDIPDHCGTPVIFLLASTIAMPVAKVTREPPVTRAQPNERRQFRSSKILLLGTLFCVSLK